MSKKDKSLALLPNGFVDLLPPEAQREADSISILMEKFSSFGYRRIKPPLLEFEDSLLAPGPGARLTSETFRLMDPVTHRMLGVRSDVTPQVARIVSSRLGNEKRPLRLTYANDVLRTKGSQMRTERQFTQVGCELIGAGDDVGGDIEICMLALLGMKELGIENITLDLTIPGVVNAVLDGVDKDVAEDILTAVSRRDVDAVEGFGLSQTDILAQIMRASGGAEQALEILADVMSPKLILESIDRLKLVCAGVQAGLDALHITDVDLTIDMVEQEGFEYHKALGFTLFTRSLSGELGRGGCYDVRFGEYQRGETAKGFTLYMDTISKCVAPNEEQKRVLVPMSEGWSVITDLQQQGWVTVLGTDNDVPARCTHVYKNGTITEIS
jgi:ATP phosphoribosyltransferase regulatory subunit